MAKLIHNIARDVHPTGSDDVSLFPAAAALVDALTNPTSTAFQALLAAFNGATWDRLRVPNIFKRIGSGSGVSIASIATVWTPASGKKFRLIAGFISVSAAGSVLFEDNAAGAVNFVFETPKLLADTPFPLFLGNNGKLSAMADNVLKATAVSGSGTLTGTLIGTEE